VNEETKLCFLPESVRGTGHRGHCVIAAGIHLSDYTDMDQLVEILSDLDDPRHRNGSGRQARQTYLRCFTRDATAKRILEMYRSALARPLPEPDPEGDVLGQYRLPPFGAAT
jgi:hypothetical protein